MILEDVLVYISFALFFSLFGYFFKSFLLNQSRNFIEVKIKEKKIEADKKIYKILRDADQKAEEIIEESKKTLRRKELDLREEKERLSDKDKYLDDRQSYFNKKEKILDELKKKIDIKELDFENQSLQLHKDLQKVSGMSEEEALGLLFHRIENRHKEDLFISLKKLETVKNEKIYKEAQELMAVAMQKCSRQIDNSLVTSTVDILSDDVKGKIIGKEGRNIRSFERETGVQLIVDDTPNLITISSFDPIRRKIAKISLQSLISGDIIHPTRIEEEVEVAKDEVEKSIKEKGLEAVTGVGLYDIPEGLLDLVGRLYFRTSYGQNVLEHSLEVTQIATTLAEELGANVEVVRYAALFHDIGKAIDSNVSGSHVEIGRKILKNFGVSEDVIKAMQTHHREYPNETLESYIVDTADAISASRPGARNDNAGMYIQKLEGLERITKDFDEVLEAYALSAGREIRVFVKPEMVDDYRASKLAREIALRIEEELKYPGEIKIALIRETKIIEFAR